MVEEEDGSPGELSTVEVTSQGKYRCRYCGVVFENREAADAHHRRIHVHSHGYLDTVSQR